MRYTIFKRGGYNQGVIGTTGGEVAGKVILSRNPIGTNEASTKNYVDVKFNALPVGSFTSGIINAGRVPEFAGDIVKLEGNANTTVKTTTVSAGMYPKVTVNIKGQITGGATLVEGDIPVLPWSKIATGKPTTIGGYGISDCLSTSGGVITGSLKVSEVTSDAKCLVNKSYMDSYATGGGGSSVSVGGIIYRNSPTTPTGFLKCNGGEVSKTTYAALYSVIGDRFGTIYEPGCGQPWRMGTQIIDGEPDITAWTPGINTPVTISRSSLAVTKNAVYILGTYVPSNGSSATIYKGTINAEGTITDWVVAGSMPYASYWGASCVIKDRLYTFAGTINGTASSYSLVSSCKINADGTLGSTWRTETGLPGNMYGLTCVVLKNRLHVLCSAGGYYATYNSLVQSDGALSNWTTGPTFTTVPNGFAAHAVIKDYLYILGGAGSPTKIQRASINADGSLGGWSDAGTLPYGFSQATFAVTKTRIYLIGGFDGSSYVSRVMHAPINIDGTIGSWTSLNSLPSVQANNMAFFTKNKLYLIGNSPNTGTSALATTYYASMSSEGGFNDYMPFYDGTIAAITDSTKFRLPDYTPPVHGANAYIKF